MLKIHCPIFLDFAQTCVKSKLLGCVSVA